MATDRQPYKRQARDEYDMNLPEGKTCGDCVHFRRCNGIYGLIAADEVCDWTPSRFRLSAAISSEGGR
ncbi:hypothetical protein AVE30378_02190 [Achromobacter veterisilvae]|uniref:Uncharacterized protein n=1 Tax=Achromobacter veterisilvae TaxID=2069367 RepID=A0A446CFP9_9BURK|nr:hypothetical protein [Achromobacter veterisilvae]SSW66651.1 hypothetical protein AVE30378_02190 [Achromobacter veterisilvae]